MEVVKLSKAPVLLPLSCSRTFPHLFLSDGSPPNLRPLFHLNPLCFSPPLLNRLINKHTHLAHHLDHRCDILNHHKQKKKTLLLYAPARTRYLSSLRHRSIHPFTHPSTHPHQPFTFTFTFTMNATKIMLQGRQPMIRFLGKRTIPSCMFLNFIMDSSNLSRANNP